MTIDRRWLWITLLGVAFLCTAIGTYATIAILADSETVTITFELLPVIAAPWTGRIVSQRGAD